MARKEIIKRATFLLWTLFIFAVFYQFILASEVYEISEYYYAGFALYFICMGPVVYLQIKWLKLPMWISFFVFIPVIMFPLAIYLGLARIRNSK